jgi:hypothetical protein
LEKKAVNNCRLLLKREGMPPKAVTLRSVDEFKRILFSPPFSKIFRKRRGGRATISVIIRLPATAGVVVGFYCPSAKLIIELDGDYHGEYFRISEDLKRDEYLKKLGYMTLRFENRSSYEIK